MFVLLALQFIACLANMEVPETVGTTSEPLAVSGLFSTGVDAGGAPLIAGSVDPHYTLSSNDPLFPGPDAIAVNRDPGWTANTATSKWISVQLTRGGTTGSAYTYTTTFTLGGVDPTTAQISGQWACDDQCVVDLNGTQVAARVSPGWISVTTFTIPAGSPFQLGTNTLAFVTTNTTGGPTGLQVVSLTGTVSGCTKDNQCSAAQFCDTQAANCVSKLPNGTPVPTLTGHAPPLTGVCSAAVGTAVCVSAVCDTSDNDCGLANGDGPCSAANGATVCRSGACSTNLTCEAAGGCNVDADCTGGNWCNEGTHTCTGKLANGTPIPSDPPHANPTLNGTCTNAAATLVCSSAVCDVADSKCGYADGDGACTPQNAATVCRSGACSVIGMCEPAGGCDADGDCAGLWCSESTHQCKAKIPNGGALPSDPPHTNPTLNGMCNAAAATLVCQSGLCDGTTNDCVQCTPANASACTGSTPVCGPANTCVPGPDGGADAGAEAGGIDASADAGLDAGPGPDGAADAAGSDASEDVRAGDDARADAGLDAIAEAGLNEAAGGDTGEGNVEDAAADGSGPNRSGVLEGGGLSCAMSPGRSSDPDGAPLMMLAVVLGAAVARARRKL